MGEGREGKGGEGEEGAGRGQGVVVSSAVYPCLLPPGRHGPVRVSVRAPVRTAHACLTCTLVHVSCPPRAGEGREGGKVVVSSAVYIHAHSPRGAAGPFEYPFEPTFAHHMRASHARSRTYHVHLAEGREWKGRGGKGEARCSCFSGCISMPIPPGWSASCVTKDLAALGNRQRHTSAQVYRGAHRVSPVSA